jgi:phosphate starvation-inducible protein PhoH
MASRKERRHPNHNDKVVNFNIKKIEPLTENQRITFDAYREGKNLMLHGIAGTGKSFISMYLALDEILRNDSKYKKLVIVRSVVPTRDMGFLPGSTKEKAKVYEAPYYAICNELFDRGDSYEYLKNKNTIEFITTSFIRGVTLNNCIILVDEIANCTLHELDSVITRIGRNCKIIFCGDFRQSDFIKDHDKKGLLDFIRIIKNMKYFKFVDFNEEDIVRSFIVKDYIIQKDRLKIVS